LQGRQDPIAEHGGHAHIAVSGAANDCVLHDAWK
jgi:hypothetical protein